MSLRVFRFFLFPALVINLFLAATVVSNLSSTNFCSSPFNCSNSTPILFPFSSLNSSCCVNLISCNGNVTKIRLFDSDFIVKRITYLDRSMEVRYPDSYETKLCSSPQNFTFSGRLLTSGFRLSGVNLTFFKCNAANDWLLRPPSSWKRKDCADGSLLYYYYSPQEQIKLPLDVHRINCPMYEIPAGVEESVSANLSAILSGGFFLRWRFDCLKCNTSGGQCVFGEDDAPACYCKDGLVHQKNCSDGSPSKSAGNRSKSKIIIGVVSASSSFLLAIIGFFVWRCLGKKRTPSSKGFLTRSFSSSKTSSTIDMESRSFHQRCAGRVTIFTYKELEEATHNFSPSNELGDGGFGAVYLGNLHDGRKVAVKKLYENNYKRVEQFMNEIAILSGISHPNLVCLYGCTSRHSRELLLVYEYVNNGTVGDHIHGMRSSGGHLTWKVRLNIAVETAGALAHLHGLEPPIIHRDVKTNNILLDRDFHVKVADFGLSRLFPLDVTHVSTAPQGTPGYVDPDYHKCYQLTEKSDVYSFGVVLAELISSLPAVDIRRHRHEINLANLAVNKINNHELHEFVDSSLEFETDEWVNRTVRAVAELAFRCLVQEREIRPTMDEVAETLRQIQSGECESDKVALSPEKETGALLKPTSPKSVTDQWPSHYTTPNNSG
ncbi:LEAF RUST 10 DISEASE-RESISTANCE LOCUS RECEPTOR-LIKE PROTEIN KINASE-like 1.2 isoform X3 [Nymphaea colorata]|nr:LEAF RUST 10 DISEASE-RESISTANCE LOCUS RECEPTOR-LIKE PROTEIN KINASE-like 1.2 isoform X3 [Nymphaea colorata]